MDSKENKSTPAATWRINGEPDPHGTHYDGERAALVMGHLTDDEMANAIFMNYDANPSPEEMLAGTGFRPIVWATAAKERIRWLSRALVKATASAAAPQVVADERALPPIVGFGRYSDSKERGMLVTFDRRLTDEELAHARAALASAPVQAQERFITDETAAKHLDDLMWEFIETSGNFPSVKIDPRTWEHALCYAPVQAKIPHQIKGALTLAMAICDAVPTRAHLCADNGPLKELGRLVNVTENGIHGYALIRDALTSIKDDDPVQPEAVPDGELREVVGKVIRAMESSAAPIDLAHALGEVSRQGGRIDFDADLMAELLAAYSASPAAQCDAKDAERWRALLGSARIRMIGSSGLREPMPNNYAHFGMEIWTIYGSSLDADQRAAMVNGNILGREWLTKYADIAIAAIAAKAVTA